MSLLTTSAFVALSVPESGGPLGSRVQIAAMLAMLAGLIQLAFAFGRLGELVRFVSRSVIVGLSAGAGVLIAIGQIPAFFGIDLAGTHSPYEAAIEKTHRIVQAFTQHGASISRPALIVGCVSLVVALLCGKISRWLPKHLLAIAAGVLYGLPCRLDIRRPQAGGHPSPQACLNFSPPPLNWHAYRPLLGPAFAIALVGMIEVCGISKSLAAQDPHAPAKPIDPGQEFVAIGIANVAGSCFSCMPSSGSYSRSALNQESGARSRFAGVASAIITAALFLLAAPAASAIPMASIAAILFVIAAGLINVDYNSPPCSQQPCRPLGLLGHVLRHLGGGPRSRRFRRHLSHPGTLSATSATPLHHPMGGRIKQHPRHRGAKPHGRLARTPPPIHRALHHPARGELSSNRRQPLFRLGRRPTRPLFTCARTKRSACAHPASQTYPHG